MLDSPRPRIGVCGFCVPQAKLFSEFTLLEVQQTFYKPPQVKTVEKWRALAPETFEFTIKAFQTITHLSGSPTYRRCKLTDSERLECGYFRDTPTVRHGWEITAQLARALKSEFIVFQCPPNWTATDENILQMRAFFDWVERGSFRFAWEPRHDSWTDELIRQLCHELSLIHTVDPFERQSDYGSPRYYRLHGEALGKYRYQYRYDYSDDELNRLQLLCAGVQSYVLFNNISMARDCQRFEELYC